MKNLSIHRKSMRPVHVAFFVLLVATSCATKRDSRADCSDIMLAERRYQRIREVIGGCSPIEKVELYLASIGMTVPPSHEAASDIAPSGGMLVNAVLLRIDRSVRVGDERSIVDLLVLLEEMNATGTYDVSADSRLRDALYASLVGMKNEELKGWADDLFRAIWEPSSNL